MQLAYGEFMKKSLKRDRLEKEEMGLRALINSLGPTSPYASHNSTGIVYDKTVLNSNLQRIIKEIALLNKELEK